MAIPSHHKEIFKHLLDRFGNPVSVADYLDNSDRNPVPIGAFGPSAKCFYSTIGVSDRALDIPDGMFEFAAFGKMRWLPNALASSVYWLRERTVAAWPMICEDVVKHNAKSPYRHMAFVPANHFYLLSTHQNVGWLLGIPIKDSELSLDLKKTVVKAKEKYPAWLFDPGA